AVVVLGLLFVHGKGQVWLIWLVTFVYGLIYTFLSSGQSAFLASMLPAEMLVDANGVLQTVREGLRLVGPLTGAALFAVFGGGTVAILDSATFLVAALALTTVHVEEDKPVPAEQHWFAEVTAGARHVWKTVVLRQMLIATAIACLVFGFFESISFAVVTTGLHRKATFLGVIIAVQGVGALAGGISSSKVIKRFGAGPVAGTGLLMVAGASLLFATHYLAVIFAAAVVFGVCLPWIIVGLMTMLQTKTPNELQGRVASAADVLLTLPQTLSIAVGALLIGVVDYRLLLIVTAGVVTVAAAYLLTRPEQWQSRLVDEPAPQGAELAVEGIETP
ncbi:MAG TPA: MFS transporter, partial [Acidimicrobiales bacterium]|nr:MFS transporter [Acidimicrobiales bacterium]